MTVMMEEGGRQVRLFLVDGTVGGPMTAEILNWTGHMLRVRRKDLARVKDRPEASRTGVYVLFGPGEDGRTRAYIGEGDSVVKRLERHHVHKDFWEDAVIITSKDMNLTKAHARYLESALIGLAERIGRVDLDNGNAPSGGAALPEADESDMRYFIAQIRILMPVLGFDIFRGRDAAMTGGATRTAAQVTEPVMDTDTEPAEQQPVAAPGESRDSPIFEIRTKDGVHARAQVIDGEFTVLAGSVLYGSMREPSKRGLSPASMGTYRKNEAVLSALVAGATPGPGPELVTLTKDEVFTSPSAAAAVVYARVSSNGRVAWQTTDGSTYAEWEEGRS